MSEYNKKSKYTARRYKKQSPNDDGNDRNDLDSDKFMEDPSCNF